MEEKNQQHHIASCSEYISAPSKPGILGMYACFNSSDMCLGSSNAVWDEQQATASGVTGGVWAPLLLMHVDCWKQLFMAVASHVGLTRRIDFALQFITNGHILVCLHDSPRQ